jgi:hypothetical protein
MRLFFCIVMLFVIAAANAAVAPAAVLSGSNNPTAQMTPVTAAPNEMLGMVVCDIVSATTCAEMKGFSVQEYKLADYVRMKVQNVNARIIGLQYDPRNRNLFIFFAVPEE